MVNTTSMQGETLGSDSQVGPLRVSLVVVAFPEWVVFADDLLS